MTDATAAILQAPLGLATMWSQFAEQMQRADTPQHLAGLPVGVAAEQAARWAQLSTQFTTSLLDVQAAWFKQFEALATQLMSPLFARDGRLAPLGSAQDIVEPPGPNGPMQVWWSAQKMWSESAKVWLNAMSHDLQDASPPATR